LLAFLIEGVLLSSPVNISDDPWFVKDNGNSTFCRTAGIFPEMVGSRDGGSGFTSGSGQSYLKCGSADDRVRVKRTHHNCLETL
jgi:hypothetical protein